MVAETKIECRAERALISGIKSIGVATSFTEEEVINLKKYVLNQKPYSLIGLAYVVGRRRAIDKVRKNERLIRRLEKKNKKVAEEEAKKIKTDQLKKELEELIKEISPKITKGVKRFHIHIIWLIYIKEMKYAEILKLNIFPNTTLGQLKQWKCRGLRALLSSLSQERQGLKKFLAKKKTE